MISISPCGQEHSREDSNPCVWRRTPAADPSGVGSKRSGDWSRGGISSPSTQLLRAAPIAPRIGVVCSPQKSRVRVELTFSALQALAFPEPRDKADGGARTHGSLNGSQVPFQLGYACDNDAFEWWRWDCASLTGMCLFQFGYLNEQLRTGLEPALRVSTIGGSHRMELVGIEPTTPCVQNKCSPC